jgi:hypothetical protein
MQHLLIEKYSARENRKIVHVGGMNEKANQSLVSNNSGA